MNAVVPGLPASRGNMQGPHTIPGKSSSGPGDRQVGDELNSHHRWFPTNQADWTTSEQSIRVPDVPEEEVHVLLSISSSYMNWMVAHSFVVLQSCPTLLAPLGPEKMSLPCPEVGIFVGQGKEARLKSPGCHVREGWGTALGRSETASGSQWEFMQSWKNVFIFKNRHGFRVGDMYTSF